MVQVSKVQVLGKSFVGIMPGTDDEGVKAKWCVSLLMQTDTMELLMWFRSYPSTQWFLLLCLSYVCVSSHPARWNQITGIYLLFFCLCN